MSVVWRGMGPSGVTGFQGPEPRVNIGSPAPISVTHVTPPSAADSALRALELCTEGINPFSPQDLVAIFTQDLVAIFRISKEVLRTYNIFCMALGEL